MNERISLHDSWVKTFMYTCPCFRVVNVPPSLTVNPLLIDTFRLNSFCAVPNCLFKFCDPLLAPHQSYQ